MWVAFFGEALTYVKTSRSPELPFRIANGDELKVPSNFVILGNDEPIRSGRGRGRTRI